MASPRLIERLRAEDVLRPQAVVEEAKRAGLRLALACALLEKESGKGRNVFGHDPTIFVGAGEVTRAKYREYKRRRVASGNRQMQGVGPCQLPGGSSRTRPTARAAAGVRRSTCAWASATWPR